MQEYFQKEIRQTTLFGAALGLAIAILLGGSWFWRVLLLILGWGIGRMVGTGRARKKTAAVQKLLYEQNQPDAFLQAMSPLVAGVPSVSLAAADGHHQLAAAYEMKGDYARALTQLDEIHPEQLKKNRELAAIIQANHRMQIYLLQKNAARAREQLTILQNLQEETAGKTPQASEILQEYIRIGQIWLAVLEDPGQLKQADLDFLQQQKELSHYAYYRQKMQNLAAQVEQILAAKEPVPAPED